MGRSSPPIANRFRALFGGDRTPPVIIAHRGDSSLAPENTLEAARLGWESGADAWELDIQLSRDGVPIVLHDESLLRTTNVATRFPSDGRASSGYLASDFDSCEIFTLDAGSWFLDASAPRSAARFGTGDALTAHQCSLYSSGDVRVPTLVQALRLTADLDWLVNIELKTFPNSNPALLDAVLAVVDETDTAHRVLISSFDHADVARAARLRPEIATGVLSTIPLHRPAEYVRHLVGADFYHPSTPVLGEACDPYRQQREAASLRIGDLVELHSAGIPVLAFTVNDDSPDGLAAHLVAAGVRGLFTDHPGRMRTLFGDTPRPSG